jgi:hypothetical protein
MVLLYSCTDDTAVVRSIPDYISRTNPDGYFRIDNVKQGKYRLYALRDDDNSRNYNLPDEEFAFMDSPIEITTEKNYFPEVKDTVIVTKSDAKLPSPPVARNGEHQLYMFTSPKKNHYLTSSGRPLKYLLNYTLSLPPDSLFTGFSIAGTGSDSYFFEPSRNRDTVKVWLTDSSLYNSQVITALVKYPFTDTLNAVVYKEDTIPFRFSTPRVPKSSKIKKVKYPLETNISSGSLKPGQNIVFTSKTPFREPDTSLIRLFDVTDAKRKQMSVNIEKDKENSGRYVFSALLSEDKKYLFIADSAAFGNIFGENTDSTGIKFTVRNSESYSRLTLNITGYTGGRIIQLLDKSEKLIGERYMEKDGKILFPLLDNGDYRIRVIYDHNGDKSWTTGDFSRRLLPEPVSYYPGEVKIKVGWDAEQDWDVQVKNIKEPALREIKTGK